MFIYYSYKYTVTMNSLEQVKTTKDIDYFNKVYEGQNFNTAFKKLSNLYNGFIDELENGKYQVIEVSDEIESLELLRGDHLVSISGRGNLYHSSELLKEKKIVLMWHINELINDISERTKDNYVFVDTGVYGYWKGIAVKGKEDNLRFANKSLYGLYEHLVNLLGLLNDMFYNRKM